MNNFDDPQEEFLQDVLTKMIEKKFEGIDEADISLLAERLRILSGQVADQLFDDGASVS